MRLVSNIAIVTFLLLKSAIGELTCYCNLPSCISTGFTCKTTAPGRCFFYVEDSTRITVHGCTHLRGIGTQNLRCQYVQPYQSFNELLLQIKENQKNVKSNSNHILLTAPKPIIGCCQKPMCNHPDYTTHLEVRLKAVSTESQVHALDSQSNSRKDRSSNSSPNDCVTDNGLYTDQEVWFRAAVIAVPISGGFIMMILIFIAIRLLKRDILNFKFNQQRYKAYEVDCLNQISPNSSLNPSSSLEVSNPTTSHSGREYLIEKHFRNSIRNPHSHLDNSFSNSQTKQGVTDS